MLAPPIGGYIYESVGYRSTCDFVGLIITGFAIVFFLFNVGFGIFREEELIERRQ